MPSSLTIKDVNSDLPVVGATVLITGIGTFTTNNQGKINFTLSTEGTYTFTISKAEYKSPIVRKIQYLNNELAVNEIKIGIKNPPILQTALYTIRDSDTLDPVADAKINILDVTELTTDVNGDASTQLEVDKVRTVLIKKNNKTYIGYETNTTFEIEQNIDIPVTIEPV